MAAATIAAGGKVGFWRRTGAYIIDAIVLGIIGAVLGAVLYGGDQFRSGGLNFLVSIVYFIGFWTYWNGQTIGDRVLGFRVVKTDGSALTLTTAIIRYIGLIIAFLVVFIGVIWVAFDPQKQGWHDKIAGTYVVPA